MDQRILQIIQKHPELKSEFEEIYPELKESEDERIRNLIYCLIRDRSDNQKLLEHNGVSVDKALAYLENQKEKPKTVDSIPPFCLSNVKWADAIITRAIVSLSDDVDYNRDEPCKYRLEIDDLKKLRDVLCGQKEQKPAEWKPQPESLEALMYAIEGKWEMIKLTSYLSRMLEDLYEGLVNTYNVNESLLTELPKTAYTAKDIEELRALKAKIEASMEDPITKPVEKQDYSDLNDLERAILRGFLAAGVENVPVTIIKETAQECLAQMKRIGWSEEEERHLYNAIEAVKYVYDISEGTNGFKCVKFLKSLRPQSHWRPSEEQMRAVFDASERNDGLGSVLRNLYNDLKKL